MIRGLPERLIALRTQHGLSQSTVAERLQLSKSIISGYETGERTPSTDVLLKITALYHCSADYLLGIEQSTPAPVLDVTGLSEEQIQALQTLINTIRHE
jgi:transcriptional regulator with XRE-family HTH domain